MILLNRVNHDVEVTMITKAIRLTSETAVLDSDAVLTLDI